MNSNVDSMIGQWGSCILLFLVCMMVQSSSSKTTTANWAMVPSNCKNPWPILLDGYKRTSTSLTNLALTTIDPFQSFIGIKCDDGTMGSCEGIGLPNQPNLCMKEFKTDDSQIMVKQEIITSINKELFLLFENDGKFLGASDPRFTVNIPPLEGNRFSVKFQDGIVSCHSQDKTCHFWGEGSKGWKLFPSMKSDHFRGSLNNVGGQLVAIGGFAGNEPHQKMEIFNGSVWLPLPDLDAPRRGFATVVINRTSVALIGGVNNYGSFYDTACTDFLMYHVDTNKWVRLPDYPHTQADLSCSNFHNGTVQGIFCIGGDGNEVRRTPSHHAFIFDWNTERWDRAPQYDLWSSSFSLGSIVQFKDWLYYVPHFNRANGQSLKVVFTLNLNATTPTWEDSGLIIPNSPESILLYQVDMFTLG